MTSMLPYKKRVAERQPVAVPITRTQGDLPS